MAYKPGVAVIIVQDFDTGTYWQKVIKDENRIFSTAADIVGHIRLVLVMRDNGMRIF